MPVFSAQPTLARLLHCKDEPPWQGCFVAFGFRAKLCLLPESPPWVVSGQLSNLDTLSFSPDPCTRSFPHASISGMDRSPEVLLEGSWVVTSGVIISHIRGLITEIITGAVFFCSLFFFLLPFFFSLSLRGLRGETANLAAAACTQRGWHAPSYETSWKVPRSKTAARRKFSGRRRPGHDASPARLNYFISSLTGSKLYTIAQCTII